MKLLGQPGDAPSLPPRTEVPAPRRQGDAPEERRDKRKEARPGVEEAGLRQVKRALLREPPNLSPVPK